MHRPAGGRVSRAAVVLRSLSLPLVAVVVAGVALLVGPAPTAAAHDAVLRLVPADGTAVASATTTVRLELSEPPRPGLVAVRVIAPGGRQVAGAPKIDGTTVTVPIEAAAAGRYQAAYRVVSQDGHPVSGTWTFTVRGAAAASPTVTAPPSAQPSAAATTTPVAAESDEGSRWGTTLLLVTLGLLAAVGLFAAVAWRGAVRRRREE